MPNFKVKTTAEYTGETVTVVSHAARLEFRYIKTLHHSSG